MDHSIRSAKTFSASLSPHLRLHLIIAIWGCTGLLGRLIELPSIEVVFLRCLIAAITLKVWLRFGRSSSLMGTPIHRSVVMQWLGIGVVIAVHWILLFGSINVANLSVGMIGLATTPLWTAIIDPIFQRQRFRPHQFIFSGGAVLGIAMIFGSVEGRLWVGFSMAILSAFLAAIFSSLNVFYTHRFDPSRITAVQMMGAAATCFALMPWANSLNEAGKTLGTPTIMDWLWIFLLSVVCTVFAYTQFIDLLKQLSVYTIILSNNLEPVYGIALGAILFGDHGELGIAFYGGACIIVGMIVMETYYANRLTRRRCSVSTGDLSITPHADCEGDVD